MNFQSSTQKGNILLQIGPKKDLNPFKQALGRSQRGRKELTGQVGWRWSPAARDEGPGNFSELGRTCWNGREGGLEAEGCSSPVSRA